MLEVRARAREGGGLNSHLLLRSPISCCSEAALKTCGDDQRFQRSCFMPRSGMWIHFYAGVHVGPLNFLV